ncbi:hypothetical protein ACIQ6R_27680 [Streptomyces sp. NPDC096048]|uniref:hypothetical protein n=1 Tax=Streptomyces sp. NPDC096048 TaxID=3366072 RepID=UPI003823085B
MAQPPARQVPGAVGQGVPGPPAARHHGDDERKAQRSHAGEGPGAQPEGEGGTKAPTSRIDSAGRA